MDPLNLTASIASSWASLTTKSSPQTLQDPDEILLGADDGQEDALIEAIPVVSDSLDGGWFGRVGTTLILVLGTFGNVMTVTILRRLRRSGWSALNVYLTALALSDMAMLYSGALPMWTRKVLDYDMYSSHVAVCKAAMWIMHSSASTSAWLLVALTLQRAASVVWPHRVSLLCTRGKSVTVSVTVGVVMGGLYCHTLYGYQVVRLAAAAATAAADNSTVARCTFGSPSYQRFWVGVFVKVDIFVYSLLPCCFLLLSNAVLGWKLAEAVREARANLTTSSALHSRQKKTSSTTVTVIIISAAFVVITLPLMTYNTFFHGFAASRGGSQEMQLFLYDFFFIFGMCNFAWNFYLYCLTGTRFRREFVQVLWCGRRGDRARAGKAGSQGNMGSTGNSGNEDF